MSTDEFSFVNRQLAGMLKAGFPLEGALRQLVEGMQSSPLRQEFQQLETDLSNGVPLREALARRQLPSFYVAMLNVGIKSNQLPGVLILLADYYQKVNSIWLRLKGLMVYPAIVLGSSLVLSVMVASFYPRFTSTMTDALGGRAPGNSQINLFLWFPVTVLGIAAAAMVCAYMVPSWRRRLRWRLPAFREAAVSQLASALALMLENGCTLKEGLELIREMERGSPAQLEIEGWLARLASGEKNFAKVAMGGKVVPPLFVWLVCGSGEDWVSGFRHAAEIYYARAMHRVELFLYAVLPASVIALGLLIICQIIPMVQTFTTLINWLGEPFDF